MIKISVILPVYNVEEYIGECLLSLKKQTFENFEVIIVDDGSSDHSIDRAKLIISNDKRFKIVNKVNGGLSDARNYGVQFAQGEYITFIDSDDFIGKDLFLKVSKKIDEKKPDIIMYDFVKYYSKNKQKIIRCNFDENDKFSATRTVCNACNKIIKLSFWKTHNFKFPVGIWYEDIAIIPALLNYTDQIEYINDEYYYYRTREGSITKQNSYNAKSMDIIKAFDYLKIHLDNKYPQVELEYLEVLHILYLGTQRFIAFNKIDEFNMLIDYVQNDYPNWMKNIYIKKLTLLKKIYIYCVQKKMYFFCKVLVKFREKLHI